MQCLSRALALTPEGHPDLPRRHADLGASYTDQYRRTGDSGNLEQAMQYLSRALTITPEGHPDLPRRHADLGVSYTDRYRRTGDPDDLEQAMQCKSRALALTPEGHADLPRRHADLGVSYTDRYRRTGDSDDLEQAMQCLSRALALTPGGHPHLPRRHADLGASYTDRYRRTGDPDDLEQAMQCYSRALALTPKGRPDLPGRHADLGVSYTDRYRRTGNPDDLEQAMKYKSRALALTPKGHPDLPDRHADLGVSYTDRYRRTGNPNDLEQAMQCYSRALALTPEGHPDLPRHYASLGVSYGDLYRRTNDPGDLKQTMKYHTRALELTPDGHPDLPFRHFNRALSCHDQFQLTNHPSHFQATLHSLRSASHLSTGAPRDAFRYAFRWAKLASEHTYLNPLEAFRTTIDLLPHHIWLGATTAQRYHDLSLAENVAVRAASTAIQFSEYSLALEWLEHARCIVWSQTLILRSPVDDLALSHPDLAARLQATAQQLHHASSGSQASNTTSDGPGYRHHLARKYAHLLAQARQLPGFEDFLQPKTVKGLMRAARHGPVVVVNCHGTRCDALVIVPGQHHVGHVALSEFTEHKARHARSEIDTLLQRKGLRERGFRLMSPPPPIPEPDVRPILASLWKDVVRPVLDYLGYLNGDGTSELPHVTWCPTGAVSFLPLHAAGDYDQPGSRVFDHVVSSYTPTLTALLGSASTMASRAPQVLAIGMPATPGCSPLRGVYKELDLLRGHTKDSAGYSQLIGSRATTTAVLEGMDEYDWVHLACHAHQNVEDATKSGFYLHDGTLDLSAISQRSFRSKGLAYLSACKTATGDEKLPDEAIHLASGMLMAGYRSVIGSMWSVMDNDAPYVADRVYARLMKDGRVGNGEAGRALHYAIAELREKVGEKDYGRWVPYIHIGS
ncbi:unnamed protein product [Rhizoctonia solani]|uniref:CHAT domain-containing protein n=1 Tax=Rhizoctonia solani TaxID=456999 RepID=A0A8H2XRN8_9AGAM|nr:unnamed protein product [Rhizoctonia solani]